MTPIPLWKRVVSVLFCICFVLVFIDGVAAFVYFMSLWERGSLQATAELTARITSHGSSRWVKPQEAHLYHTLLKTMLVGIPSVFVAAFVLQFGLKVPLFGPEEPRPQEAPADAAVVTE